MNKYREALEQVVKDFPEEYNDLTREDARDYIRHKMSALGCKVNAMYLSGFEDGCWVIPQEDVPGMYVTVRDINDIPSICIIGG